MKWSSSNPCPSCGRAGHDAIRCTNCNTVGCDDGNCAHGGTRTMCSVCRAQRTKVKI